jgi:glycosyltransferase involved in cell wall biosynthesis
MLAFSIIVPSIDPAVITLIRSLEKLRYPKDSFEVIVIKDRKNPILFPDTILNLKVLNVENSRNPSSMRNLAIAESKGDILAFIDDDAEAFEDWLSKAFGIFSSDPGLAVLAGPTMLHPQAPFRERLSYEMAHAKLFGNGHDNLSSDTTSTRQLMGHINSCNMFIKKEVLLELGKHFDVHLGYGGEDTLLVYHLLQEKYKVLYSCSVMVYHRRKEYGTALLKQKFAYRMNNGLMFWVNPSIYWGHFKFIAGFLGATLFAIISLLSARIFLAGIAGYFIVSYLLALSYIRKSKAMFFSLPVALFTQHIVYFAGILCGVLSIFSLSGLKRIQRLKENV